MSRPIRRAGAFHAHGDRRRRVLDGQAGLVHDGDFVKAISLESGEEIGVIWSLAAALVVANFRAATCWPAR